MESNYFNNQDWLNSRLGRFTASEIHKLFVGGKKKDQLFGQGAMTYIRSKAAEILTQEVKDEIDFKQAEWGKNHELEACQLFEKVSGFSGTYYGAGNPKFFEFGDFEGCSPDWEITGTPAVGADIKCPFNSSEHLKNLLLESGDDLKAERWEYYCQLQFSMYRRGWECAYFVSYDPRFVYDWMQLKIITIYPDSEWRAEFDSRIDAAISELKEMVKRFTTPFIIATRDESISATIIEKL